MSTDDEMDTIILLTDTNCYIVNYDDDIDSLTHYQKIPLTDLYAIDIGNLYISALLTYSSYQ